MSLEHAREMRSNPTEAEAALWQRLRRNRLDGIHFRRQALRGRYIVDFLAPKARLVVEIDGGQHGGAYDAQRDRALQRMGYTVLRFWNNEALTNVEGVLEVIRRAAHPEGEGQ